MQFISKFKYKKKGHRIIKSFIKNKWDNDIQRYVNLNYSELKRIKTFKYLLLKEQQGFCCYCMRKIPFNEVTLEHVMPHHLEDKKRKEEVKYFHKYENGDIVDTIYPDGRYEFIQTLYNGNYYRLMREKDYPVVNAMQYDREGKLLYWDQEFLHGETISAYTVEYDKNGQVAKFYNLDAGDEGYIYPTYSIHQLLDKLKKENIDLLHNISIYYYGKDYYDADSVSYKRWGWYVDIKDSIASQDSCNMTGRLYNGQTGELLDVYRGIWEDFHFNFDKEVK